MADQRVAFVTGGNKGIGLETARGLGRLGYAVVLGSRDGDKGEAAARLLHSEGLTAVEPMRFDVTDPTDHTAAAAFIEHSYGKLDALVNNAGVWLDDATSGSGPFNTTLTVPMESLRATFDTNFFGVVGLTQTLLPLLRRSPAGRVVNLSSVLGSLTLHAQPGSRIYDSKAFAYDASKTALNAFTVHLAQALRETPIKVNSAHPGWVKTDMGGPAAMLDLGEGGKTSVRLATLAADGPTGGYFHLDQPLPW